VVVAYDGVHGRIAFFAHPDGKSKVW
jgi:hypothetical protein